MKILKSYLNRREFIRFMGRGSSLLLFPSFLSGFISACRPNASREKLKKILGFVPLKPSQEDQLLLADGFESQVLIKWGDPISKNKNFGSHNDYVAFLPSGGKDEGLLWVNHEYMSPLFLHGESLTASQKTKEHIDKEQAEVGGSIVYIKKDQKKDKWGYVKNHPSNRRLDGKTRIPFVSSRAIQGSRTAMGTLGNCAGGVTPWGSILTCEENYEDFYGDHERDHKSNKRKQRLFSVYYWDAHYHFPSEHYGWVVEVNPLTGKAKKLTSLGRFSHEGATMVQAGNQVVVYMGDDRNDQRLYKFVSDAKNSLETGTLYAANTSKGVWIPIDYKKSKILQKHFIDQTDVLIYTRKAAHLLGATPLDRPEDIEIDPKTGNVFVSLTNNLKKGNYHGQILKLEEKDNNPLSMEFKASHFLTGGESSGFSCPDNLAFDVKGNLWFASDISGKRMNKKEYSPFKNNGLFYVPMSGTFKGQVFQAASAPVNAEFTGITFLPDGTLLISVQHPGEYTKHIDRPLSRWPNYGRDIPRSAVVSISGTAVKKLLYG